MFIAADWDSGALLGAEAPDRRDRSISRSPKVSTSSSTESDSLRTAFRSMRANTGNFLKLPVLAVISSTSAHGRGRERESAGPSLPASRRPTGQRGTRRTHIWRRIPPSSGRRPTCARGPRRLSQDHWRGWTGHSPPRQTGAPPMGRKFEEKGSLLPSRGRFSPRKRITQDGLVALVSRYKDGHLKPLVWHCFFGRCHATVNTPLSEQERNVPRMCTSKLFTVSSISSPPSGAVLLSAAPATASPTIGLGLSS